MINIVEFIGYGKENAVHKQNLMMRTGLTDREVRKAIEFARKTTPIINNQDGAGYYIATKKDIEQVKLYSKQERSRAMSILKQIKYLKSFIRKCEFDKMFCFSQRS